MPYAKTAEEARARAYCESIGADPDEVVAGCDWGARFRQPRWRWYVGAVIQSRSN
jgi:hypothetical protein